MDKLYSILQSAHSGWRWIVLVLLVIAIVKLHIGWKKKQPFTGGDKKIALFAMISYHIQFLFGILLYFVSPKVQFEGFMGNKMLRFFTLEHSLVMIIAMVLITMGYSKAKKKTDDTAKFKTLAIFYTVALILILARIPWPFQEGLGASWF